MDFGAAPVPVGGAARKTKGALVETLCQVQQTACRVELKRSVHACLPAACAPVALCPHASRCSFPPSFSRCTDPRFAPPPLLSFSPAFDSTALAAVSGASALFTPPLRSRSPLFSRSAPPSPSPAVCLCVRRQVEVWEGLAPQLEIRSLVILACTHRDLKTILDEAHILKSILSSALISRTERLYLIYLLDS
jgi:hypothetical protein